MSETLQEPEKLDMRSHDITEDKIAALRAAFPEAFTEGDRIDFERLKLALGESVDVGKERYGMNWPGKAECFRTIQQPSLGTLRPCPEESVEWDTTENLIIEGDNLEVLKLLQKAYLGKVKMIYIDPPYNTGNDFIYPDNYTESLQTYLEYTGQADSQGKKFSTNTETDGRFHSKWLNMMYPRLYLARNLLREDGVIFISIDDHEIDNLKKLCNEIFGEELYIETFIWKSRLGKGATAQQTAKLHEYVICYANNAFLLHFKTDRRFAKKDTKERLRQWGQGENREDRPSMYYPINSKEYGEVLPKKPDGTDGRWRVSKSKMDELIRQGLVVFKKQFDGRIEAYRLISAGSETATAYSSILDTEIVKTTAHGSIELKDILGVQTLDYPKPSSLIRELITLNTYNDKEAVVLDFFAGSGTTAQAVLELNKQDGGNRKFILVQLPEPTDRADFPNIADICKERVRRVIKKLNEEDAGTLPLGNAQTSSDRGFKVFKLADSNFKPWDAKLQPDAKILTKQLELHIDHISSGRTDEDILYEILLKSGFPLTSPVEKITLADKTVYSVASDVLLLCLDRKLTQELIRAMAERKPERVVCLDEGFTGNDQLKANAVQIFKTKNIVFKTV
ncbi:MAG: site-specific DNA-methyltransferase [Firmicutes bacterium]|nr:site-specific DNA-methyltransferase [Bacillota bacterium]